MPTTAPLFPFDNSYARELEGFYVRQIPSPAPRPSLTLFNRDLAEELGLSVERLSGPEGLAVLSGQAVPPGADPLAQTYAGHQFGGFSPRLGDGRALLLGEIRDQRGQRRDLAFKGSGRTPFSRGGDGKCALGPALREYLMGEAMHALGIPTTRILAVVSTGEHIRRERPLPGAIICRVAASHLRVGTFEYAATHLGPEAVRQLADYALQRHDPALRADPNPYLAWFQAVCDRQAHLIARWLGVGFIHGVMNTDNMTISGETLDYGPCAFMEAYDPATVFSSIDHHGRYAYGQQADIAQWNLARLAESILPLLADEPHTAIARATEILEAFPDRLGTEWRKICRAKLGIAPPEAVDRAIFDPADQKLADDFLSLLHAGEVDFTRAFRALYAAARGDSAALPLLFPNQTAALEAWSQRWQARQPERSADLLEQMRCANPRIIPRNHRVEEALEAATEQHDLKPCHQLLAALKAPYDDQSDDQTYTHPAPAPFTRQYRTFCGT